jgi:hypothetical protein
MFGRSAAAASCGTGNAQKARIDATQQLKRNTFMDAIFYADRIVDIIGSRRWPPRTSWLPAEATIMSRCLRDCPTQPADRGSRQVPSAGGIFLRCGSAPGERERRQRGQVRKMESAHRALPVCGTGPRLPRPGHASPIASRTQTQMHRSSALEMHCARCRQRVSLVH